MALVGRGGEGDWWATMTSTLHRDARTGADGWKVLVTVYRGVTRFGSLLK